MGQDVVDAGAIVAARGHDEAVHQQRLAVDRVDEVRHRVVVVDGAGLQHDLALVALGAGLVQVEGVGLGAAVRSGQDRVVAVAVLAGRGLLVSLGVPDPVDAAVVLLHDVAVTPGARAVQRQRIPLVVRHVVEIRRAPVAVGAEPVGVHRALEDRLVHVELERGAALGLPLEILVVVAGQAVVSAEGLVVALAVDRLVDFRGAGGPADPQREE